ncbi:MAG: hypothetical protein AB7K04_06885 [Pseudorhodoplanes sp.]
MSLPAIRNAVRVDDPIPLGDVTLAPPALTGLSEAQLARVMAEKLLEAGSSFSDRTLQPLRDAFAHSPLTMRMAALAAMMRR